MKHPAPLVMPNATVYTDGYTGKQYYIRRGYSAEVRQFAAGARVWMDGSSNIPMQKTNFKTRALLNSWLRMMGFKD